MHQCFQLSIVLSVYLHSLWFFQVWSLELISCVTLRILLTANLMSIDYHLLILFLPFNIFFLLLPSDMAPWIQGANECHWMSMPLCHGRWYTLPMPSLINPSCVSFCVMGRFSTKEPPRLGLEPSAVNGHRRKRHSASVFTWPWWLFRLTAFSSRTALAPIMPFCPTWARNGVEGAIKVCAFGGFFYGMALAMGCRVCSALGVTAQTACRNGRCCTAPWPCSPGLIPPPQPHRSALLICMGWLLGWANHGTPYLPIWSFPKFPTPICNSWCCMAKSTEYHFEINMYVQFSASTQSLISNAFSFA